MTLSSATVKTNYSGDGATTDFPTDFIFWETSDPKVILVSSSGGETTYTEGTHYTVSGGVGATGTIALSSSIPPSAQESLVVKSNVLLTQETDLTPGGAFATEDVEDELDRTVRRIQQLNEETDRTVTLSEGSTFTGLSIPTPTADKFLGWNSAGDDLTNLDATDLGAAVIGVDVQAWDADLDTIAGLSKTDGNFVVADGSSWVAEASSVALNSITPSSSDGDFLVHNGTNWVAEASSIARTSIGLATVSSSEAEAGTGATERGWTPALVKQAIDALESGGTKEKWFPITAAYAGDAAPGIFPYTIFGDNIVGYADIHASTTINGTGAVGFNFHVPNDFTSLTDAVVVSIADATETITYDIEADWGAAGEDHDNTTDSAANETTEATASKITEHDVSATLTGIAAGDYVGLRLSSDTAWVNVIGLRLRYS